MKTVFLCRDATEPQKVEEHQVEDVCAFLSTVWDKFPDTGRIYHEVVSQDHDVTPSDDATIEKLQSLEGKFHVVIFPGDPTTIIIAVVGILLNLASTLLLQNKTPPTATQRNTSNESPNNSLSDRQNEARINGRIPDIFGTVRSTPDLITAPYKLYEDHEQVEYAYMCIGRGAYDVDEDTVFDDATPISSIEGSGVEIYGPDTSPNSGAIQLTVGETISEPLKSASRSSAVNGQLMKPPNYDNFVGDSNVSFERPNKIVVTDTTVDLTDVFEVGDGLVVSNADFSGSVLGSGANVTAFVTFSSAGVITFSNEALNDDFDVGRKVLISGASVDGLDLDGEYYIEAKTTNTLTLRDPEVINSDWSDISGTTSSVSCDLVSNTGIISVNMAGTYEIIGVTSTQITLDDPLSVNSDWGTLTLYSAEKTGGTNTRMWSDEEHWIGPFILTKPDLDQVFCNFVALNGLYRDNGSQQERINVAMRIELTPVDASNTPTGSTEAFTTTVQGSSHLRTTRAITRKITPTFTGRYSIRARRTTSIDLSYNGTIVDEIKWEDLYQVSSIDDDDFGDVTTAYSMTRATEGALAVKNRKLNMEVTRKLPERISGDTFSSGLVATNNVADIVCAIALDPYIGNRTVDELDVDNIYDTAAEIETYFGHSNAVEFCYTFDDDNLSFEETISTIAAAVFCNAYRRGSVLNLSFEKETDDSILLFNHRNKIPGSEKRTVTFGNVNNYDGVEYSYVDPADDAVVTYYLPVDRSARNPKKVESIGVRNGLQAYLNAWRIWNKIQYQKVATEFDATQDADLVLVGDRVLVADNTRPDTIDGEIDAQDGLVLTLSQSISLDDEQDYTIFLQHVDGTSEALAVSQSEPGYTVNLGSAPRASLSTDPDNFAKATFITTNNSDRDITSFLIAEREPSEKFISSVKATQYDARFYGKDKDYANGVVDETGTLV